MDIPIYYALLAGAISFLSPCVLPLVPPYLCYMTGSTLAQLSDNDDAEAHRAMRRKTVMAATMFVLGFSVVFVSLGASATLIGKLLLQWSEILSKVAGILIILMGLHFIGILRFGFLQREARFRSGGSGIVGSFLMGLAFAFGWTPCIGPILAPILALAGSQETVAKGAFLLAVYSAGLGIPFLLAAMFVGTFVGFLRRFSAYISWVEFVAGIMLIATGILFLTGGLQIIAFWLLEAFPFLAQIG